MILRVLMQRRSLAEFTDAANPYHLISLHPLLKSLPVIYTIRSEGHELYVEGLTNQIYCLHGRRRRVFLENSKSYSLRQFLNMPDLVRSDDM